MDAQPEFAAKYESKVNDYLKKGYARNLSPDEATNTSGLTWYLRHFGVYKVNKPGKLRFFSTRLQSCGGTSLNDALVLGPDLLTPLVGVPLCFRQFKLAFG